MYAKCALGEPRISNKLAAKKEEEEKVENMSIMFCKLLPINAYTYCIILLFPFRFASFSEHQGRGRAFL